MFHVFPSSIFRAKSAMELIQFAENRVMMWQSMLESDKASLDDDLQHLSKGVEKKG